MTDPSTIQVVGIIAAFVIPFGIMCLANWYGRAVARREWGNFAERTPTDKAKARRELTVEELIRLHEGVDTK